MGGEEGEKDGRKRKEDEERKGKMGRGEEGHWPPPPLASLQSVIDKEKVDQSAARVFFSSLSLILR